MGSAPSSNDLVTKSIYDADGRLIEQRLPGATTADANGTSPRTTKTTYYSATGSGDCVSPTAAGLVCKSAPGGQPSGTTAGSPLPTTVTVYDFYGNPTSRVETFTSDGTGGPTAPTRTTSTVYDAAERVIQTSVTTAHVSGSQPVDDVSYAYDPSTGRQTSQSTGSGTSQKSITTSYDLAGQVSLYKDATGDKTYTGYDIDGRVVSRVDAKGATTWTYDNSSEHRGLVTVQRHAGAPVSTDSLGHTGTVTDGNLDLSATAEFGFTASYNLDGVQSTEGFPNGVTATGRYDNTGDEIGLTYANGATTWMAFTHRADAFGRIATRSSSVAGQTASSQTFAYDHAGRLVQVQDTVGPAISGSGSSCTTRQYGFDQHSNRTSLATYPAGAGGTCSTTTSATTVTSTFNEADRITGTCDTVTGTGTYCYDPMGRTLTVPSNDAIGTATHASATGQLSITYLNNDLVATQAQGTGVTKQTAAFDIDVQQDRFSKTTISVGSPTTSTTVMTRHYDDNSDVPAWTDTTVSGDATSSWTAYVPGINGSLAASVSNLGVAKVALQDLDGDIVAEVPLDGSEADVLSSFAESTEFGAPRNVSKEISPYGWLGANMRSNDALGGTLIMGARLYNPATGRFLSVDPIANANANNYVYPQDPIGNDDLSGKRPSSDEDGHYYVDRVWTMISTRKIRGHTFEDPQVPILRFIWRYDADRRNDHEVS